MPRGTDSATSLQRGNQPARNPYSFILWRPRRKNLLCVSLGLGVIFSSTSAWLTMLTSDISEQQLAETREMQLQDFLSTSASVRRKHIELNKMAITSDEGFISNVDIVPTQRHAITNRSVTGDLPVSSRNVGTLVSMESFQLTPEPVNSTDKHSSLDSRITAGSEPGKTWFASRDLIATSMGSRGLVGVKQELFSRKPDHISSRNNGSKNVRVQHEMRTVLGEVDGPQKFEHTNLTLPVWSATNLQNKVRTELKPELLNGTKVPKGVNVTVLARNAALLPVPHGHTLRLTQRPSTRAFGSGAFVRGSQLPTVSILNFLALKNAFVHGDITGKKDTKSDLYTRLFKSSAAWLALLGDIAENEISMLWLGCFDGPEPPLAPLVFAADNPQSSVAILHACQDEANLTAIAAAREMLEVTNTLILHPKKLMGDDDDEAPGGWIAGRPDGAMPALKEDCDLLVISPGAVMSLLATMLPPDAELMLARVLQWCLKSAIIEETHESWPYANYWSTPRTYVDSAINQIQGPEVYRLREYRQPTKYAHAISPDTHRRGSVLVVARNMSSYHAQGRMRLHLFRLKTLRATFSLTDSEAVRIFANAFDKDSLLPCIMVDDNNYLAFKAGLLVGCDPHLIAARRRRFQSIAAYNAPRFVGISSVHHTNLSNSATWGQKHLRYMQAITHLRVPSACGNERCAAPAVIRTNDASRALGVGGTIRVEQNSIPRSLVSDKVSSTFNSNELSKFAQDEGRVATRWWPHVKRLLRRREQPFSVLVHGENLGMVALRLARKHKLSTIVVKRSTKISVLEKLAATVGANNVITASESHATRNIMHMPYLQHSSFSFVFLGASTVAKFLADGCSIKDFQHRVTDAVMQAGRVALVELPRFALVEKFLSSSAPTCRAAFQTAYGSDEWRLMKQVVQSVSEHHTVSLEILSQADVSAPTLSVPTLTSSDTRVPAEDPVLFKMTLGDHIDLGSVDKEAGSVAIGALLNTGVTPYWRSRLLLAHLNLPLWYLAVCANENRSVVQQALTAAQLRFGPDQLILRGFNKGPEDEAEVGSTPHGSLQVAISPPLVMWVPLLKECAGFQLKRDETMRLAVEAFLNETPAEHRNGRFSFFEWGITNHPVALSVARKYPNATVVSVAGSDIDAAVELHAKSVIYGNVVACSGVHVDRKLATHMYESPELARYSFLALNDGFLDSKYGLAGAIKMASNDDAQNHDTKKMVGALILSSVTTFIPLPSAMHVSLAMSTLFYQYPHSSLSFQLSESSEFADFEADLIERLASRPVLGGNPLLTVRGSSVFDKMLFPPPLSRVDVVNLTRAVHHHFDWSRDGHTRTYTMHITTNSTATVACGRYIRGSSMVETPALDEVAGGGSVELNTVYVPRYVDLPMGHHISNGNVMHVYLQRDEDASYIPYGSIRSITLIAAIRLGLISPQRKHAFSSFVKLPLYEDMAPWNIAFQASRLDYIDYDTRTSTYDTHVTKVYRVLSVLMNYKRTIQDLGMCGSKAKTSYGFSYVSECVKPRTFRGNCYASSEFPVPCDDGQCHSEFVSCLRAVAAIQDLSDLERRRSHERTAQNPLPSNLQFGLRPSSSHSSFVHSRKQDSQTKKERISATVSLSSG